MGSTSSTPLSRPRTASLAEQKLWRYCQLGIHSRSSDGKLLGYEELDPTGRSELKTVSYRAWLSAVGTENEVRTFYEESLARTQNDTHARLNTQRSGPRDSLLSLEKPERL